MFGTGTNIIATGGGKVKMRVVGSGRGGLGRNRLVGNLGGGVMWLFGGDFRIQKSN